MIELLFGALKKIGSGVTKGVSAAGKAVASPQFQQAAQGFGEGMFGGGQGGGNLMAGISKGIAGYRQGQDEAARTLDNPIPGGGADELLVPRPEEIGGPPKAKGADMPASSGVEFDSATGTWKRKAGTQPLQY